MQFLYHLDCCCRRRGRGLRRGRRGLLLGLLLLLLVRRGRVLRMRVAVARVGAGLVGGQCGAVPLLLLLPVPEGQLVTLNLKCINN